MPDMYVSDIHPTRVSKSLVNRVCVDIQASQDNNFLNFVSHPLLVGPLDPYLAKQKMKGREVSAEQQALLDQFDLHTLVERKLRIRQRMIRERNWNGLVFCCTERPYRVDELLWIKEKFGHGVVGPSWPRLVIDTWIDCESPHQSPRVWDLLLDTLPSYPRSSYLTEAEFAAWKEGLGEQITIYRGLLTRADDPTFVHPQRKHASWTLDRDVAAWFAQRWASFRSHEGLVPVVAETTTSKHFMIGPLMARGEHEVIAITKHHLTQIKVTEV